MLFYYCLIQFCVLRSNFVFLFWSFSFSYFLSCSGVIFILWYRDDPFIHSDSIGGEFCWNDPFYKYVIDNLFLFNFVSLFYVFIIYIIYNIPESNVLFFTNAIVFFSVWLQLFFIKCVIQKHFSFSVTLLMSCQTYCNMIFHSCDIIFVFILLVQQKHGGIQKMEHYQKINLIIKYHHYYPKKINHLIYIYDRWPV